MLAGSAASGWAQGIRGPAFDGRMNEIDIEQRRSVVVAI
jgi:hypothetical protein